MRCASGGGMKSDEKGVYHESVMGGCEEACDEMRCASG